MGNIETLSNGSRSVSILGSNGFIGSAIVQNLIVSGWKVDQISQLDIDNFMINDEVETIVNCVGTFTKDVKLAYEVNARFPAELAKQTAASGSKLVHFGSSAEYAPSKHLITETNETKTTNIYSESKLLGSNAVLENGLKEKSIVLRPFGVVQDVANPMPSNASNLISVIWGASTNHVVKVKNPKAIRDLVNVNEVAKATIKLLDRSMPWPKILNISSGTGHSVEEILSLVNPNIQIIHEEISYDDNYVGDTNLLRKFLDFNFDKNLNVVLFGKFRDNA